jgi:hypothetical protein
MNVEGFYFGFSRYNPANIALLIPYEKNDGYVFHWYEFKSIKHIFNTNDHIGDLLSIIEKVKLRGRNSTDINYNPVNVLGINDSGIEFLKLLDRCVGCSSLVEFKLKLQLMGYEYGN